ncbi:MAG TPA: TadE family protein [Roseiflexaceae bacterium]|nr:TadE family protein [Roseiflexaceae bacterium]
MVSRLRHHRAAPGQALVEMALTFMILIVLIFGGISAMQILSVQYTVNQAVRTAAHEAALMGSTGGMKRGHVYLLSEAPGPVAEAARNVLTGGIFTTDLTKATITAGCDADPCRRYSPITVQLRYEDQTIAPIPAVLERVVAERAATRASEKDQQAETLNAERSGRIVCVCQPDKAVRTTSAPHGRWSSWTG